MDIGTLVRINAIGNCYCSELPHEDDKNTTCDYCKYNNRVGTLARINEHNEDGDFYGVVFNGSKHAVYFWLNELKPEPQTQPGFYNHILYFPTLEQANIAECMILPKFTALMNCLGREVNEDDGPCLEFQTKEPIEEHLRSLINQALTTEVTASYNVPMHTSYEQYQQWRNGTDDDQYFTPCDACGTSAPVQATQEGGDLGWTRYSYVCTCGHSEADISFNPEGPTDESYASDQIEAGMYYWEERKLIEASVPDTF